MSVPERSVRIKRPKTVEKSRKPFDLDRFYDLRGKCVYSLKDQPKRYLVNNLDTYLSKLKSNKMLLALCYEMVQQTWILWKIKRRNRKRAN